MTVLLRSTRILISLTCATWIAGCATTKAGSAEEPQKETQVLVPAGDGTTQVVKVIHDGQTRPFEPGTRYITTLGLPANVRFTPPDWIVNPAIDGVLGSLGVAPENDLGTREQLNEARRDGRIELARMLEVRVQEVGRGDLEQYIEAARVVDEVTFDNSSAKSSLGVDRAITDLVLSGSRQRAMWFDPANGDCYVWLVMDGQVPQMADHSVENGVSIYVANRAIESEYRPDWPEAPTPAPVPQVQAPAPVPVKKSPTEKLEEVLKPIESIPVGTAGS
ncbi:hypothetical protein [Engelhardtia mirabilis]|uniref:Lipoprotein n=1 Tax=Engelhardtia mirabilis TaxID=2528011 RepID=A0A518BPR6_9BACT|nr:hypothetical protein Pla133_40890 [Planctomycetes bacterium Pla133]QDV03301.1 hypothetical protein Pla86_40880 [Planctomycetes bacterium Pla86]